MLDNPVRPPDTPGPLAAWFAEAVREELAALEKGGGAQSYEVLSGSLLQKIGPATAIFQFIIADGTRIPEDAGGRLKTSGADYRVSVLRQIGDRIDLELEGTGPLPANIPRGMLLVDDTALLRRLAEVLDGIAANPVGVSPLATTIFHPHHAQIGNATISHNLALRSVSDDQEKLRVISRACGSSLTYVWGPPGTGKTRLIAHMIAELLESGERILVASHTHHTSPWPRRTRRYFDERPPFKTPPRCQRDGRTNPGPTKAINIRVNDRVRRLLAAGGTAEVAIAANASLVIDGAPVQLDLAQKPHRCLLENMALVAATNSGTEQIENL